MVEPVNSSVLLQLTRERLEVEYPGFSPYVHDHWLQFSQVTIPNTADQGAAGGGVPGLLSLCTRQLAAVLTGNCPHTADQRAAGGGESGLLSLRTLPLAKVLTGSRPHTADQGADGGGVPGLLSLLTQPLAEVLTGNHPQHS